MTTQFITEHVSINIESTFEEFTEKIQNILGRLDTAVFADAKKDPEAAKAKIEAMRGVEGFMIFSIQDHKGALAIAGFDRKAKLFLLGNPLGSTNITKIDLRGALYAPLRLLVYEDVDGTSYACYDTAVSLFGQFGNQEINEFCVVLDHKIERIIELADAGRN